MALTYHGLRCTHASFEDLFRGDRWPRCRARQSTQSSGPCSCRAGAGWNPARHRHAIAPRVGAGFGRNRKPSRRAHLGRCTAAVRARLGRALPLEFRMGAAFFQPHLLRLLAARAARPRARARTAAARLSSGLRWRHQQGKYTSCARQHPTSRRVTPQLMPEFHEAMGR